MKPNRRLAVRREALTELTADELASARGAEGTVTLGSGCAVRELLLDLSVHWHCSWSCIDGAQQ